jgi:D-alanyl-D-alanine carboxypeptidase
MLLMKKWGFFVVVLLLLGGIAIKYIPDETSEEEGGQDKLLNTNTFEMVAEYQVYQGNLLLVNRDHPLDEKGVRSDVVTISQHEELLHGYGLLNTKIRLSKAVAQEFVKMVTAAGKDDVNHFLISSGYRDFEEQEQLYQEKGGDYALPAGRSEHNLGLSLDIGSSLAEMSRAPEGKWLKKNAWKYGFVLRYPEDKTDITGIQYEPWHFRYVGLPHSALMKEKNLVLEQYLDYLREKKSISAKVEGKAYEVIYYPVSENKMFRVPVNQRYEISGNNMDGIIVTVEK